MIIRQGRPAQAEVETDRHSCCSCCCTPDDQMQPQQRQESQPGFDHHRMIMTRSSSRRRRWTSVCCLFLLLALSSMGSAVADPTLSRGSRKLQPIHDKRLAPSSSVSASAEVQDHKERTKLDFPSPNRRSPSAGDKSRRDLSGLGSSPPQCNSKCGFCSPCRAVHVPIQPGFVRTTEYYPEAWRCKCGNKLYMP
ncbi:uncharacterized protein LOC9644158 [Selaginella moellendorffii]|uniref:uncharacterized protein LOC9644158 n=1 Tax=Selaginella moellendorffii TaxID=88036 RepID=UPI000D1CAF03|nr:uncharacterized protein LOC9644158 [Selaginella moellendorffii]XP_024544690.1 uncharacterized protein LOC9644158 [Selaginella moellendorffii]|eukprot:XP_024544689.1 uncharacterized protein LOC9644158 [Selaginella moellendorffii]